MEWSGVVGVKQKGESKVWVKVRDWRILYIIMIRVLFNNSEFVQDLDVVFIYILGKYDVDIGKMKGSSFLNTRSIRDFSINTMEKKTSRYKQSHFPKVYIGADLITKIEVVKAYFNTLSAPPDKPQKTLKLHLPTRHCHPKRIDFNFRSHSCARSSSRSGLNPRINSRERLTDSRKILHRIPTECHITNRSTEHTGFEKLIRVSSATLTRKHLL